MQDAADRNSPWQRTNIVHSNMSRVGYSSRISDKSQSHYCLAAAMLRSMTALAVGSRVDIQFARSRISGAIDAVAPPVARRLGRGRAGLLPGSAAPRRGGPDRRRLLPRAVVSRKLPRARRRSCRGKREEEAPRHHVGAARLPLLQGNASGQFRQARDHELHPGAIRNSSAQHHRLARGDGFRRREADREAASRRNTACATCRSSSSSPTASRGLPSKTPREREVARAQGYIEPQPFLAMFRFVAERAYEKGEACGY